MSSQLNGNSPSHGSGSSSCPSFTLKCQHNAPTKLQTCKKSPNNGNNFYGCPFWKTSGCGFFIWEQEVQSMMQFQQAIDNEYEDLKAEQVRMKDKVAKLKAKKKKIEDEVDKLKGKLLEMKFQVSVAAKKEKHAMRALMWTWIIVGIAGFFWVLGKTN